MDTKTRFQTLLNNFNTELKKEGYKKRGTSFYLKTENLALINFQKSKKSNTDNIVFTVNIGISSFRIQQFEFGFLPKIDDIQIENCHWRKRLGMLVASEDKWWEVNNETSIENLSQNIYDYIQNLHFQKLKDI